ncbi:MAG: hypothetical protein ACLFU8_07095 [Anaerolineales bacterium]
MEDRKSSILLGIVLLVAGIIFLLMSLNVIAVNQLLLWMTLFLTGGLAFLVVFFLNREHWWPIIPGLTLLGLAALLGLNELVPAVADTWGPAFFMAFISLAFWFIYIYSRGDEWWAIIPGGVLFTIALIIGLSESVGGETIGGIFMVGLALTFLLVFLLPSPGGRPKWALIPAGILFIIGFFIIATAAALLIYIWPLIFLLGGLLLILRALMAR